MSGARVKPLVWEHHPVGLIAGASWGSAYIIDMRRARPNIIKGLNFTREFATLEAAKAAAQADYEARILAALEPAPDIGALVEALTLLRAEHAEWSAQQFGNVSAVGPAKHLSKEALEVAADPHDAIEHADCWMLLWDMQRRAGISDAQLASAIAAKLAINKARKWPEPEEGEASEHMKGGAA